MSMTVCTGAYSFCNTCMLFQSQWICTCCCIIINFINDTKTEFIWRTLLNISQGTANSKQNKQNDLCILGRLRSDYAVRVVWPASSLKTPWVLCSHTAADRDPDKTAQRCRLIWVFAGLTYSFVYVGQQSVSRKPCPAIPHLSHFRLSWR